MWEALAGPTSYYRDSKCHVDRYTWQPDEMMQFRKNYRGLKIIGCPLDSLISACLWWSVPHPNPPGAIGLRSILQCLWKAAICLSHVIMSFPRSATRIPALSHTVHSRAQPGTYLCRYIYLVSLTSFIPALSHHICLVGTYLGTST